VGVYREIAQQRSSLVMSIPSIGGSSTINDAYYQCVHNHYRGHRVSYQWVYQPLYDRAIRGDIHAIKCLISLYDGTTAPLTVISIPNYDRGKEAAKWKWILQNVCNVM
jgi:hypothetical protein